MHGAETRDNNVAFAAVTAHAASSLAPGATLDVTVGTMADAGSLRDGTLLSADMFAEDGAVYAVAQGRIVNDAAAGPAAGATPTGQTRAGAVVARPFDPVAQGFLRLKLRTIDPALAARIAAAINAFVGKNVAMARLGVSVEVRLPVPNIYPGGLAQMRGDLEKITIDP